MKRRNFTLGATAAGFTAMLGFFPRLFANPWRKPEISFWGFFSEAGRQWLYEQPDDTRMEIYRIFAKATYEEVRRENSNLRIQASDGTIHSMPEMRPFEEVWPEESASTGVTV
jgi:hypothetical protein